MPSRLPILAKGLILIAVPLLFQLGFIALVTRMRREGAVAVDWSIHSKDVIAQVQQFRARILSAHNAGQGYWITRDPAFVRDLDRASSGAAEELRVLAVLVSDNPSQSRGVEAIRQAAWSLLGYLGEGRRLVEGGRMPPDLAATRRRVSRGMMERLEAGIDDFLAEERRLHDERHALLARSGARLDLILAGGVLASVLCTILVAVLFAKNISGRIAALADNARRLGQGRELAPPIPGADEIARLDLAFREMARTLSESNRRERDHADQLAARADELSTLNAELREKAQENEMFVYSVSHDLRSPLVNLQGFSKELGLLGQDLNRMVDREGVPDEVRRGARALIDTEMAESIGFIRTAVSRLSSIIDALLRLSRAGRVEYRRQSVDVARVVDRVVAALRGTLDGRGATVEVGPLPATWGDPTAIEQVFANLIGNAANYLDPGRPGRIEVESVAPDSLVEGAAPEGLVVYAVRDNGLGIPDAYRDKVFSAFQRLHGDVAKGEGVGLTLVRRMVERHGGRIWFESEQGRGTTFFVALPGEGPEPATVASGSGESEPKEE